jgi:hypothetical protein
MVSSKFDHIFNKKIRISVISNQNLTKYISIMYLPNSINIYLLISLHMCINPSKIIILRNTLMYDFHVSILISKTILFVQKMINDLCKT